MEDNNEVRELNLEGNSPCYTAQQLKLAGYLKTLHPEVCFEYTQSVGIPAVEVLEEEITTPVQVLECLTTLLDGDISPAYLFNNREIWGMYLLSICDSRFKSGVELVLQAGSPADLLLFFSACYKFGHQVVADAEYDALETLYLKAYPFLSYLNNTTNDDSDMYTPVVLDAIRVSGLKSSRESVKVASGEGSYASLNAEKSTSVRPLRSYQEAFEYLCGAPKCKVHASLKVDGFNTKALLKEGEGLDVALSRGRATDSWDYTESVQRIFDTQNIDAKVLDGKVTGETIVDSSALEYLRAKYTDKEYKSPKSTAGAMLRAPYQFDFEDYKHLKFYPFEYSDYPKDKAFDLLSAAGFTTPPAVCFAPEDIPLGSLEEFSHWLTREVLDPLWSEGVAKSIGSDGVVLQLLTDVENDRADKYSDLNVALKFSHWAESAYESKVVDIVFEQRRVEMSVVLIVEPVTTRDLNVATRVSVGSPAILVNDGVRIGDTISFTRKSEAINVYEGKVG